MGVFRRISRRSVIKTAGVAGLAGSAGAAIERMSTALALDNPAVGRAADPALSGLPFADAKPDYSTVLPASGDYAGDPTDSVTIDWRNVANSGPGPQPGTPGTDGYWRITQSDYFHPNLQFGDLHSSLTSLVEAMAHEKSGTLVIDHAAGGEWLDNINGRNISSSHHIIIRAPVGADGKWGAYLKPPSDTGSHTYCLNNAAGPCTLDFRNFRFGLFDADIAGPWDTMIYGGDLVGMSGRRLGSLYLRNCKVWRARDDGISVSIGNNYEHWTHDTRLYLYDFEIEYCGSVNAEHNIYSHQLNLLVAVRMYNHSSKNGHAFKVDCPCVVYDSVFKMDGIRGARPVSRNRLYNQTQTYDCYIDKTVFDWEPNPNARNVGEFVHRANHGGGWRMHGPPYFEGLKKDSGVGKKLPTYYSWGVSGGHESQHSIGNLGDDHRAGARSLAIKWVNSERQHEGGKRDHSGARGIWDIQVLLDDGTWFETTGMVMDGSPGRVTFAAHQGLPANAARNNICRFKLTTDDWDYINNVTEEISNKNHPDYYWDKIKDRNGDLDLSKRDNFAVHWMNSLFFYPRNHVGNLRLWDSMRQIFRSYWSRSTYGADLPPLPLNSREWRWAHMNGAGAWDGVTLETGNFPGIRVPAATDVINDCPMVLRDIGWYETDAGALDEQIRIDGSDFYGLKHYGWAVQETGDLVESCASLTGRNADWAPSSGRTDLLLIADHAAGTTRIAVASTAGMQPGDAVQIYLDKENTGGHVGGQLHVTTIARVDSRTMMTLADGLRIDGKSGDIGCVFPATPEPTSNWSTLEDLYLSWGPH